MSAAELAVIVPTFNERDNIRPFLSQLSDALLNTQYEVIFVDDDSPDGTAAAVREIASSDERIRLLQRIARRGLASACLEGFLSTCTPYVAVMDADLQHDGRILPRMLELMKGGSLDVVIATRNKEGGSMGNFAPHRVHLSRLGRYLSRTVLRIDITDPMSGFFVLNRRFLDEVVHSTSGVGFKILLDLLSSARRPIRFVEVPYTFRNREKGASKLDAMAVFEYVELIATKVTRNVIPVRFLRFVAVGGIGLLLSVGFLYTVLAVTTWPSGAAQAIATAVAATGNFFLNNIFTYRDRRLRGRRLAMGYLTFAAACLLGAVINLRTAAFLHGAGLSPLGSGACGLAIGGVWNYGVTSIITWHRERTAEARILCLAAPRGGSS